MEPAWNKHFKRLDSQIMDVKDKTKTSKEELLLNGFNFYYYTNFYKTKQDKTYYFVYEYGYLSLENEIYALVIKQDYVK